MQTRVLAINYSGDFFLGPDGTVYEGKHLEQDLAPAYLEVDNSAKSSRLKGALLAKSQSPADDLLCVMGKHVVIPSPNLAAEVRPELHTDKPEGGFYFSKELLEKYLRGSKGWDGQPQAFFPVEKLYVLLPYLVKARFIREGEESEWFSQRLKDNQDFRWCGIPIEPSDQLAEKLYEDYQLQKILDVVNSKVREELVRTEADLEAKLQERERLSQELAELEPKVAVLREELTNLGARKEALVSEIMALEPQYRSLKVSIAVLSAEARRLELEALGGTPEENLLSLPIYTSEGEALLEVKEAFRRIGREVDLSEILALHVAVKLFPFTVLAGESGTGKSSLLVGYARAMGMRGTTIPVQPTWSSVADFHGFVNPLTKEFVPTPFSEVLELQVSTQADLEGLVDLVLLDEINLAYVEYFLADYLSALEGDRKVRVPSKKVTIPHTLLFTGTANEDHTTRSFSDKFRDRAAFFYLDRSGEGLGELKGELADPNQINANKRISRARWNEWRNRSVDSTHQLLNTLKGVREIFKRESLPLSERLWQGTARFLLHEVCISKELGNEGPDQNTLLDLAVAIRPAQKYGAYLQAHMRRDEAREKAQRLKNSLEEQGLTRAAARFNLE
jgi:hypothetical protein